jgi:hypothetical protein
MALGGIFGGWNDLGLSAGGADRKAEKPFQKPLPAGRILGNKMNLELSAHKRRKSSFQTPTEIYYYEEII